MMREGEDDAAQELVDLSSEIKEQLGTIEEEAKKMNERLEQHLLRLPQPPHESAPEGDDESDNVELALLKSLGSYRFER